MSDEQQGEIVPEDVMSANNHQAGSPPPVKRPAVRSGLAQRRSPVLATLGEIASTTRRVIFKDLLTLFLGCASIALAVTFFVLLGSIGPSSTGTQLPISRVLELAQHRQIASAALLDHDNRVEFVTKAPSGGALAEGQAEGQP